MHPIVSEQIATHQAAELRHRAEVRRAQVAGRRSRDRRAGPGRVRSALGQTWATLTTLGRA